MLTFSYLLKTQAEWDNDAQAQYAVTTYGKMSSRASIHILNKREAPVQSLIQTAIARNWLDLSPEVKLALCNSKNYGKFAKQVRLELDELSILPQKDGWTIVMRTVDIR